MKKQIKAIMNKHLICDKDEAQRAFEFVSEIIDLIADETEREEPYATNSIRLRREMASFVYHIELDEI